MKGVNCEDVVLETDCACVLHFGVEFSASADVAYYTGELLIDSLEGVLHTAGDGAMPQ